MEKEKIDYTKKEKNLKNETNEEVNEIVEETNNEPTNVSTQRPMNRPRLEIDATGYRYLTVFYHSDDKDFTRIIRDAFVFHKITEDEAKKIPVLCLPQKEKTHVT